MNKSVLSGMNPFAEPSDFVAGVDPTTAPAGSGWWFGFCGSRLLVTKVAVQSGQGVCVPRVESLEDVGIGVVRSQYLGNLANRPCYAAELAPDLTLPPDQEQVPQIGRAHV